MLKRNRNEDQADGMAPRGPHTRLLFRPLEPLHEHCPGCCRVQGPQQGGREQRVTHLGDGLAAHRQAGPQWAGRQEGGRRSRSRRGWGTSASLVPGNGKCKAAGLIVLQRELLPPGREGRGGGGGGGGGGGEGEEEEEEEEDEEGEVI